MGLFRDNIEAMPGYVPGEQPQEEGWLKLNTNESPFPPSPKVAEALARFDTRRLRLYPDPIGREACQAAADALGTDPDGLMVCNGSDEALTILTRCCVGSGDLLVAPTPSYPLYRSLAEIQGCRYEQRPFTAAWDLPEDFTDGARLCLVPNPNSPTGTMIAPRRLFELAERSAGILVADEAYADFADTHCVGYVSRSSRLVVTRTLSKSYGLAGLRVGFIIAAAESIHQMRKAKDSYNCDMLSLLLATAALRDQEYLRDCLARIRAARGRLETRLAELGFEVTPSQANFVWVRRVEPVKPIYEALKRQRILIRYLDYPGYGEGLRISVGTEEQMDRVLAAIAALV